MTGFWIRRDRMKATVPDIIKYTPRKFNSITVLQPMPRPVSRNGIYSCRLLLGDISQKECLIHDAAALPLLIAWDLEAAQGKLTLQGRCASLWRQHHLTDF